MHGSITSALGYCTLPPAPFLVPIASMSSTTGYTYWFSSFTGRPLGHSLYVSIKWALLMEPLCALCIKRELARLSILRCLEVDFDRIDKEQEINPPPHLQARPPLAWSMKTLTATASRLHHSQCSRLIQKWSLSISAHS